MNVDDKYVYLYSSSNPVVLQLLRIELSEAGINSQVFDDSISGVYHLQALSSRIMVRESDLAEAKKIIEKIEDSLRQQSTDFDFSDADEADIEFEKSVYERDIKLERANPKFLIIFLIVAILVLILSLLAFI